MGGSISGDASTADPDGDVLSYSSSSVTRYGGQFSVDSSTGVFDYAAATGYQGQDSVSIYAEDGKGGMGFIDLYFNVGVASGNIPPTAVHNVLFISRMQLM